MPFGGGNKCGCCQKTVYFAEEVQCEGKSWHKSCFLCNMLHIALQTTAMPPSLPRRQEAQTCVLDVRKPCTQPRRLSVEAIHGIRAAFAVPNVAKDSSRQPSLTETERSTVKVAMQRTLVPRALASVRVQELFLTPSEACSLSPPRTDAQISQLPASFSRYPPYLALLSLIQPHNMRS
uniref:LIM zinc-binding domain-containing protein n=1 Tax=Amphiprion ocellaris TaxID=80972 RepID=A0A3Q1B8V7_AMPOC